MNIRHILFPTDFSEMAAHVEPYVRSFAQRFQARVTILHVIETPPTLYGMPPAAFFETGENSVLEEHAQKAMATVLPDLTAAREVTFGDAASVIAERVEEHSLVMMPTHGYGRFRRALVGSVTAKTIHDVRCPVWTLAHAEEHETPADVTPSRIICALDLLPESVAVIRKAADLASTFQAEMWLAHAVPPSYFIGADYADGASQWVLDLQNYYLDQARREITHFQEEAGTKFQLCVEPGPIAQAISCIARKHHANLLITGRGSADHFFGTMRSETFPIIQEAPCPVLSL